MVRKVLEKGVKWRVGRGKREWTLEPALNFTTIRLFPIDIAQAICRTPRGQGAGNLIWDLPYFCDLSTNPSAFHALFECPVSAATWLKLGLHHIPSNQLAMPPWRWLDTTFQLLKRAPNSKNHILNFALTTGKIWFARNLFIFEGNSVSAGSLAMEIHQLEDSIPLSS
ncbi:hypothetical protein PIB30_024283 [Stylosanthes scabra]|uniref:Reverse transcriptase zinc-binding domain-containing protein n=1 Tax=Stylosanthes scabra TaxID=79078 RepID=A0ABU6WD74_9FABA|nr:hypothetical protein [Stylosanthes scabra]